LNRIDRHYVVAGALLSLVLVVGWLFRESLLPFLVAMFVVYLMEPVVARISGFPIRGRHISRFGAVAIVYSLTIASISLSSWAFLPRLASEISTFVDDAPSLVQQLREERLPAVNDFVERALVMFGDDETDPGLALVAASDTIGRACARADAASATLSLVPRSERGELVEGWHRLQTPTQDGDWIDESPPAAIRVVQADDGSLELVLPEAGLNVTPRPDGSWRIGVGAETGVDAPAKRVADGFDLEAALAESLRGSVESGGEQVGWLIEFFQEFIGGLFEVLTTILITLMVAAFVSSDVPAIVDFFYSLFPPRHRPAARALLARMNEGLSGVIRGQVAICLVNGFLTGVGLAVLQVKFALLLAVVAAVLSLIPIFGTIVSTIPAVLVGLTHGFLTGIAVLVWILIIHLIEANILNPKILGESAKMHPVVVVFALVAGEHYFGLIGALLAVPTASIVQSLFLFLRDVVSDDRPLLAPAPPTEETQP
jgi:predicted PurR-regulated permease PerM